MQQNIDVKMASESSGGGEHAAALRSGRANFLAPMVRVGTLPMRMLCLQYGASLVYTEELIDRRLALSTPVENAHLGTTDFVDDKGVIIFRTTPMERERVVLQIGTASPELALQAASVVAPYVAGAFLQGSWRCVSTLTPHQLHISPLSSRRRQYGMPRPLQARGEADRSEIVACSPTTRAARAAAWAPPSSSSQSARPRF